MFYAAPAPGSFASECLRHSWKFIIPSLELLLAGESGPICSSDTPPAWKSWCQPKGADWCVVPPVGDQRPWDTVGMSSFLSLQGGGKTSDMIKGGTTHSSVSWHPFLGWPSPDFWSACREGRPALCKVSKDPIPLALSIGQGEEGTLSGVSTCYRWADFKK